MQVLASPKFLKEYKKIVQNYTYIAQKIVAFKDDCKVIGFSYKIFDKYDIKSLGDGFFRVKFPPLRIIIHINKETISLEKIFKRKGNNDYKELN